VGVKTSAIVFIVTSVLFYLGFAFANASFDVSTWSQGMRISCAGGGLYLSALFAAASRLE
jgi:hypothetical protein